MEANDLLIWVDRLGDVGVGLGIGRLIAGMRDRLIHGYDTVDLEILWQTATNDVPALLDPLAEVIRKERIAAGEID